MTEVRSTSPQETLALGRRLATLLEAGDVVLLAGKLGSGKTLLVSGVAEGLGIAGPVVSPSFVLVREYRDGFLPLIHADVYRLGSTAEFDDLELPDSANEGVLLIEWGSAVAGSVPDVASASSPTAVGPTGRSGSWHEDLGHRHRNPRVVGGPR